MVELTKENFEAEVEQAEGISSYGDGCVPCAALMPYVHGFADTYGDKLKFCALNTTKASRLAI
ncbi:MAG: thioredoxin family protein [Christensenellales bacterium]